MMAEYYINYITVAVVRVAMIGKLRMVRGGVGGPQCTGLLDGHQPHANNDEPVVDLHSFDNPNHCYKHQAVCCKANM